MACRLVGAKQLSETMMVYCQLASLETNFSEILIEIFFQENAFENVVWKMAVILSRPQCFNKTCIAL